MTPSIKDIREGINATYDQYHGARINFPAVIAFVARSLNVSAQNYRESVAKIEEIIRDEVSKGNLAIAAGKGGGVWRVCDQVRKPDSPPSNEELDNIKFAISYLEGYAKSARKHKHGPTVRELGQVLSDTIKRLQA